jgi:hypothetical protein
MSVVMQLTPINFPQNAVLQTVSTLLHIGPCETIQCLSSIVLWSYSPFASWNPCVWSDGFGAALIVWPFFPSILLHVLFYVHLLVKILLTKNKSIKTYSKGSTRDWDKRNEVSPQHKALLKIPYWMYHLGGLGAGGLPESRLGFFMGCTFVEGVHDSPSFKRQSSPKWASIPAQTCEALSWIPKAQRLWVTAM